MAAVRNGRGAVAGGLLFHARNLAAADREAARSGRADGAGDRLQSRHFAAHLAVAGDEHGGDAVPPDGGGMPGRGHARGGAARWELLDQVGTLEAGKFCDLAIWDIERPAELVYRIGANPLHQRIWRGQ